MDISVVIVSYNVKEFLRGAILSVERALKAGNLAGEIVVVDNDSADSSAEMVAQEFPSVKLFALKENLGFGRANNLGFKHSSGEYLLMLNPDTIVGEDTLRYMVDFMRSHPEAGMSGCKLLNADGSFQLSCRRGFPTPWASFTKLFGLSRAFPKSKLFARYNLTYLPDDQTYEVDALGGAFMLMSRPAYEATSGFDEDYFMYGEDLDLCFRTQKAGFKVYYVHGTATIHFKGESTKRSAINEVNVFYEAMHIFVRKNYGSSPFFHATLRVGIFLRTLLALARKYRGAVLSSTLDYLTVVFSVILGTRILLGSWFALPSSDYPYALLFPPVIVLLVIALLQGYNEADRRSAKPIVLAMPAILIALSSVTYFFKEFPTSRPIVLTITAISGVLLLLNRLVLQILDRIRWGGDGSASPVLRRTLVVGTSTEAVRIAELLKRTEFLRRYEIVGFIDRTLEKTGQEPVPGLPILGDTNMMAKVIRNRKIGEVIFASDALPYSDILSVMQRVSAENLSRRVNFNMVPTSSEVLIGKQKIELLAPHSESPLAIMPVEYNLQRLSHRFYKRLIDVVVSGVALPILMLIRLVQPGKLTSSRLSDWKRVFRGELTLVGVAGENARTTYFPKRGVTSLAAITAPKGVRAEDIDQFDQYYARNQSVGMDCEILLKSLFFRRSLASPSDRE